MARSHLVLVGLGVAVVLYALSRTQRGADAAGDVLEFVDVNARKIVTAIEGWTLPAAGESFRTLFDSATARYALPPGLLSRVAYQESHFRADIISGEKVSSAGAQGIMQLVPKYHPSVNPLDPREAIPYAAGYLRQMFDRFGSWTLALAAYNAGPGNVSKYGGIPPFTETQNYVRDIAGDVGLA